MGYFITLVDNDFGYTKVFNFDIVQFIFSLVTYAFGVISKKSWLNPML